MSGSGEGMSLTATRPDTSYLLRKLHSLSGLLPVGAFLAEHFWSNSAVLVSPEKYNEVSRELQTIPFRPLVEFAVIVLPILFHGGYGVYIWLRGKSNVSQYPWVGNWMYTLSGTPAWSLSYSSAGISIPNVLPPTAIRRSVRSMRICRTPGFWPFSPWASFARR